MAALVLGGIVFAGFEIPDKINFGGKQKITVHQMIGGDRVLDAMGSEPEQISWSGRFRGLSAIGRAQALDEMRISGAQVDLAWLSLFRTVVVSSFTANTEKAYEVPYTISCEVVSDVAAGLGGLFSTIDALIGGDLLSLSSIGVTGTAVSTLSTTLNGLGSLTGAKAATRNAATAAVTTASNALAAQFTTEETALGQTMPGGFPTNIVAWLASQSALAQQHSATVDAQGYVGRIAKNLAVVKA